MLRTRSIWARHRCPLSVGARCPLSVGGLDARGGDARGARLAARVLDRRGVQAPPMPAHPDRDPVLGQLRERGAGRLARGGLDTDRGVQLRPSTLDTDRASLARSLQGVHERDRGVLAPPVAGEDAIAKPRQARAWALAAPAPSMGWTAGRSSLHRARGYLRPSARIGVVERGTGSRPELVKGCPVCSPAPWLGARSAGHGRSPFRGRPPELARHPRIEIGTAVQDPGGLARAQLGEGRSIATVPHALQRARRQVQDLGRFLRREVLRGGLDGGRRFGVR